MCFKIGGVTQELRLLTSARACCVLAAGGVALVDLLKHVDLELSGVAVLLDVLDDLQRNVATVALAVAALHHLAERSLAQLAHNLVCKTVKQATRR